MKARAPEYHIAQTGRMYAQFSGKRDWSRKREAIKCTEPMRDYVPVNNAPPRG